jgi:Tachylectin
MTFRFITEPDMSFRFITTETDFLHWGDAGPGTIYAVTSGGGLLWYRDVAMNGAWLWAANSSNQIGLGWAGFQKVFAGNEGVIYAIKPTGELLWYKDLLRNGTNGAHGQTGWHPNSGKQIGVGWNRFKWVFSGGFDDDANSVIYAIAPTGELYWYADQRKDGMNGSHGESGWHPRSGSQIGVGWESFTQVFPGGDGMIYAVASTGRLLAYLDKLRNGTNGPHGERGWHMLTEDEERGTGFDSFTLVLGGGSRSQAEPLTLYAFTPAGALLWYGDYWAGGFAPRSGDRIGDGWFVES